jgi:hypothetical protein
MARIRPSVANSTATGPEGVLRLQNRTISVIRGVETNPYGDQTNLGAPLYTGIPAALAETTQTSFDGASQRQQIVRAITCEVPHWADILTTDTITDEATGYTYMIESMEERPGPGYYPPTKILTLRMRSGVTVTSD